MARKKLKNVAKIAAALGAAYALSKMGKGTMDGTEGDFPSTPEPKKVPQASQAMGDEYMDTPKRGSVGAFKQSERERQAKIAMRSRGPIMNTDRSAFNAKVKAINEARSGMKNPRYNKGGSVHVKTKIGYSKPTKIC
jgi:hypothetical protein